MGHELRDYQEEAVQGLYAALHRSPDSCPLVVMPTGSGKSHVIAEFVRRALEAHPGTTILMATHVKELVEQNLAKLLEAWPAAPAGVYSAGLGRRDVDKPITFAGVQSIYSKASKFGVVSILLVDECHRIPRDGTGMYLSLIEGLRTANPGLRIVGFTATEFRTDSGLLYTGEGALFTEVCYRAEVTRLIDAGWLSEIRSKGSALEIDLSDVHVRGGEYVEAEQEVAALRILSQSIAEIVAYGQRCKKWLVFCVSIAHAQAVKDRLRAEGVAVALVTGETPTEDRDMAVSWFRTTSSGCLVNVSVFTTGFDVPDVDLVVLLRATKSPVLYVQMVGRGMRRAPGKTECVLLDFGSNVARHGPINRVRPKKQKDDDDEGVAPLKQCPECKEWVPIACRECPDCHHQFDIDERPAHSAKPDPNVVIAREEDNFGWFDVDSVSYRLHQKQGRTTPTVRVVYQCGVNTFSEWVCPEHEGFAGKKAMAWWIQRGGGSPAPERVDVFLLRQSELDSPSSIQVDFRSQWPVVVKHAFERDGQGDGAGAPASREAVHGRGVGSGNRGDGGSRGESPW